MAILCMASCDSQEYDIYTTVHGLVTDASSAEPLEAVTVTLSPGGMNCLTNRDGEFKFADVDAVQYKVMAQKEGYVTNHMIVTGVAGESVAINITLRNKS